MEKLSANHSVAVQFPGTPTDKLRKVDGGYSERAVLLSCGSFSPVTRMHLQMLELAKTSFESAGSIVVGAYLSPVHDGYGKPNLLPASQRLDMLRLATENSSWIMVESWECTQPATSPSYAVAQHLLDLSSVGFDKIVFVCGADLAISMTDETKWPRINVQRLCSTASIGVLNRGGSGAPPASLTGEDGQVHPLVIIDVPPLFGSSTEVRDLISKNLPIGHLVDEKVAAYIREKRLFE